MNSHQRRIVERRWPHSINIDEDFLLQCDIFIWLLSNFGSPDLKGKKNPRWCWRPDYKSMGNFAYYYYGIQVFFRKKEDYTWFLMKWEQ